MSQPARSLSTSETATASSTGDVVARPPPQGARFPAGIPYIIGNEAAERFSFYGMRAILWIYLTQLFVMFQPLAEVEGAVRGAAEAKATEVMHLFMAGVYAVPMIGALVADRLLGKYRVIMWLSVVYCIGHGVLAVAAHTEVGVYTGLALIAVGSGGIKPCVSANVGDQFTQENSHLVSKVYQWFYFSINFGSFASTLLTPWLMDQYGPDVAFGVPGILMGLATLIFWMGRNKFVKVPPRPGGRVGIYDAASAISLFAPLALVLFGNPLGISWPVIGVLSVGFIGLWYVLWQKRQKLEQDTGFISMLVYALRHRSERKPGDGFFEPVRTRFGEDAAEGPRAVLRIAVVFSMVTFFWALFDQHSSSWINQANRMDLDVTLPFLGAYTLKASQIPALNPLMVMLIIPFLSFVAYPLVEKLGVKLTPLRKMTTGMVLTAVSFAVVALIQSELDEGNKLSVLWQVWPYLIITLAEVLVSVTGLEFAYTQAPRTMKSTIMGFWLLTVAIGNKLVAFLAGFESLPLETFFWIFAGMMGVAAVIFGVLAYFYKGRTYLQESAKAA